MEGNVVNRKNSDLNPSSNLEIFRSRTLDESFHLSGIWFPYLKKEWIMPDYVKLHKLRMPMMKNNAFARMALSSGNMGF